MPRPAVLLVALLLAACGQLPRPFVPEQKAANDLLYLGDRAGIVVRPMAGDRPGGGADLAAGLAAALRDLNVPAATLGGNGASWTLDGHALVMPMPEGHDQIVASWELRDARGARAGAHSLRQEWPRGAWRAGDPARLRALAAEAALAIAAVVQDPAVEMAAIPGFPGARLVVLPLAEAPGDGEESLPRALAAEFLAAKLPVAEHIGDGDLLVLGAVSLGPPDGGAQDVEITWQIIASEDDTKLGEIAQRNRVPAGALDGAWGGTARAVARGAAAGVIDLLGRTAKR